MTDNKRIVVFVSGISDHFNAACVSIIGGFSMSNYTSVNLAVADPRFYTGGTNPYVAKSPTNPMKLKEILVRRWGQVPGYISSNFPLILGD